MDTGMIRLITLHFTSLSFTIKRGRKTYNKSANAFNFNRWQLFKLSKTSVAHSNEIVLREK